MKLIHKLVLAFGAVSFLIWITAFLAIDLSKKEMQKAFIANNEALSVEIMNDLDRIMHSRIEIFQAYARDEMLRALLVSSNQKFIALDDIGSYMNRMDQEWRSAGKKEITLFMQDILGRELSIELREKIEFFEEQYGFRVYPEVFATNKYGANVAQTGKTSDYYQADEEWWQNTKENGLHVGDIEYDESADVYSTDVGIRVDDESGAMIGILKVVISIEEIINTMKTKFHSGMHRQHNGMKTRLVTKEGNVIYSNQDNEQFMDNISHVLSKRISFNVSDKLNNGNRAEHSFNEGYGNDRMLITHVHSRGFKNYKGLSWILIVCHRSDEIFAPIEILKRQILMIAFIITVITLLFGVLLSKRITDRIRKVHDATVKIGKGDLSTSLTITSNDEIGQLAGVFQQMIYDLRESAEMRDRLLEELKNNQAALQREKEELSKTTDELFDATSEIETNREQLGDALLEISKLIQVITKNSDTSIRIDNYGLQKCYEVKNCGREECPCYGKEATRCWQVAGTYCGGEIQGEFAKKYGNCTECCVFKDSTTTPVSQVGEQFNNMMHVIELKNQEIQSAYEELKGTQAQMLQKEKMASIGQLAAGVAHEINNPMGFISSNLGTLGKYAGKMTEFINVQADEIEALNSAEAEERLKEKRKKLKLDYIVEDVQQLIEESLDGAERVVKIVQNLKTFSRVDQADCKMADINECIESTLNIVWNELKYKVTMEKDYGKIPMTKCYPQQLNQVFMNLLVNGAHAIEEQGEIRIKTWNGDKNINISISDTGGGIPADKLGKIFEPFFTTKEVGKGTGLGLSIAYDIVKKHNGTIAVESETGKGTTFTIKIPVTRDASDIEDQTQNIYDDTETIPVTEG